MNNNSVETFSSDKDSMKNTLENLKNQAEWIGKNPLFAEDYQELLKTIANIEEKIKTSQN